MRAATCTPRISSSDGASCDVDTGSLCPCYHDHKQGHSLVRRYCKAMSHYIPEKRMDRNGKLVTRHVRAGAKSEAPSSIPAPALASKGKAFTPLNKQLAERDASFGRQQYQPRGFLLDALGGEKNASSSRYIYHCNDVDAYDVLAILPPADAVAAIATGTTSADAIADKLRSSGLDYLLVDNSEMVDQALRRRIPAPSYIAATNVASKTRKDVPADRILDAADIHGIKAVRDFGFHVDIIRGDIRYEDIKTVGASTIANHEAVAEIRSALWEIKTGEFDGTAEDLKGLIKQADKANCSVKISMNLAKRYGVGFARSLYNVDEVQDLCIRMGTDSGHDALSDETKAFIRYYDDLVRIADERGITDDDNYIDDEAARDMFNAGIDPDTGIDAINQNMTSVQVLAIRDHDIAPSVSGGWL